MRVAAISDIHGDFELLKLVWQKLDKLELTPEKSGLPILNAGDNVVYGPDTNECIDFLREQGDNVINVAGNYDRNVARFHEKEASFIRKWQYSRPEKLDAICEANEQITDSNRAWLADLPKTAEVELGGVNFLVTHYRPGDEKISLFGFTPDDEFAEIADSIKGRVQVVVAGHTHREFVKRINGVLFVNPGSVGRPLYEPTFAVIDISEHGGISGEIVKCQD